YGQIEFSLSGLPEIPVKTLLVCCMESVSIRLLNVDLPPLTVPERRHACRGHRGKDNRLQNPLQPLCIRIA
ncbi:MAG: hypothetical protein OEV64_06765, partial [Desulfobulbaceae bacterium]|nr:hypothetical protein [Desulfobulbaceae bacterium]